MKKNKDLIAENVKRLRFQKEYTQENVANDLGMSTHYFRRIEKGTANPTVNILEKIAGEFGVSLRDLLNERK